MYSVYLHYTVLLTIDPDAKLPIYQQIADSIRALIASGKLTEGQPLPSVRQMAADLGVNLNTIAAAYRQLRDEGLIALKHGSRASVAVRAPSKRKQQDLRRPLRDTLAKMILAGLGRGDILGLVNDELRNLAKGTK